MTQIMALAVPESGRAEISVLRQFVMELRQRSDIKIGVDVTGAVAGWIQIRSSVGLQEAYPRSQ